MTQPTETTEWSLVLDGDPIDSTLGHHHAMNGLDEATARRRLQTWTAYRPEVKTTLRRRVRITHVGEWSEVSDPEEEWGDYPLIETYPGSGIYE